MNSTLLDENFTSILNTTSNDLTFTDIILNPFFNGGIYNIYNINFMYYNFYNYSKK